MRLSIASSLYRSAGTVDDFVHRSVAAARLVTDDIEVVLVDDGSPDDSLARARALSIPGVTIRTVGLSRNFGHLRALMTALRFTTGDLIFLLDSDLEEPPECLPDLLAAMRAGDNVDLVYGMRDDVASTPARATSGWFFSLFNRIADVKVPEHQTQAKLMTRRFVDALVEHDEVEPYLAGLVASTGFTSAQVPIAKQYKGTTTYSRRRRARLGLEAVVGFSDKPLTLLLGVGMGLAALAVITVLALAIAVLFGGASYAPGWASIIAALTFFSGLIIAALGVIGFYVGRIFVQVKGRPITIRDVVVREASADTRQVRSSDASHLA